MSVYSGSDSKLIPVCSKPFPVNSVSYRQFKTLYLRNTFGFRTAHVIMNASGLLQSK